jgi:hypothetical protein
VIAIGRAGVKVNEIRLLTGVLEFGTSVNVALGSGVFVGLDVGTRALMLDGIGVGVAVERSAGCNQSTGKIASQS